MAPDLSKLCLFSPHHATKTGAKTAAIHLMGEMWCESDPEKVEVKSVQ